MGKSKKVSSIYQLPLAPWIYINDPTSNAAFVSQLTQLIPKTAIVSPEEALSSSSKTLDTLQKDQDRDTVIIIPGGRAESKNYARLGIREEAAKRGCNFADINLSYGETQPGIKWTANHLDLQLSSALAGADTAETKAIAEKMYKWLFTVLTVRETLHLMSDEMMRRDDQGTGYRDYEYCSLAECRSRPKDAKIQFVALILTKPVVTADKRLTWQVADKTGAANFFFKYRDDALSSYTWDWVLKLQPGTRQCLPRMPSVKISENPMLTIAAAPFRFTGTVIEGTGHAISLVGKGVRKAGKKLKMGKRSKWVPEADVARKAPETTFVACPPRLPYVAKKEWKDDDSMASTTAGSVLDEKDSF